MSVPAGLSPAPPGAGPGPDPLFAVERYDAPGDPPGPVELVAGAGVRLVAAVRLAADDVVLALIEGPDPETVAAYAAAAGWRVDRLTPASWITPPAPPALEATA